MLHDPFVAVILLLVAILLSAVLGRGVARRFGLPAVLGELVAGVLLGNVAYQAGLPLAVLVMHLSDAMAVLEAAWGGAMAPSAVVASMDLPVALEAVLEARSVRFIEPVVAVWVFANLGLLLLLFMVGLETRLEELKTVGTQAAGVALVGVIVPFALGGAASFVLAPDGDPLRHIFLGAALTVHSKVARVALASAVIDDVLGLAILAVISGIVLSGRAEVAEIAIMLALAGGFLLFIFTLARRLANHEAAVFARIDPDNAKLLYPLVLCLLFAVVADLIGLATIIGAFAAGVIVSDRMFAGFRKDPTPVRRLVGPLERFFAPIYFVVLGMQVNLEVFVDLSMLGLGLVIVAVAILGKMAAGLAAGRSMNRLAVGVAMIPRGEVTLVFAGTGKALGVLNESQFGALVAVVLVTLILAPPALKFALGRTAGKQVP
jgi:Kef-type K+ transport system membrane component KefB